MAFSIGELFVSLGFDVDDSKLKSFNDEIVTARDGLFKVAAGASAAFVAVTEFLSGPIGHATEFKQFTDQMGYSAEGMQEWARVASLTNRTVSFDQALQKYQQFASYVQKIPTGQAGGGLASLLRDFNANLTPEQYLGQLSDAARSGLWAQRFGDNWRSFVIPKLQQMGLGGDFIDALMTTAGQRADMTKGMVMSDSDSAKLDETNRKFGEMLAKFEAFGQQFAIQNGDKILAFLTKLEDELPKILKEVNDVANAMGGWKSVGELILLYFGTTWAMGILGSIATVLTALGKVEAAAAAGTGLMAATAARGIGLLRLLGIGGVLGGSALLGFEVGKTVMEETGWGQKFADWAVPIQGKNVIDRSMDSISNFMNGNNPSPAAGPITSTITVNIHSNESPQEIAREVGRQIEEQQRKSHVQADDQLNLGAVR